MGRDDENDGENGSYWKTFYGDDYSLTESEMEWLEEWMSVMETKDKKTKKHDEFKKQVKEILGEDDD